MDEDKIVKNKDLNPELTYVMSQDSSPGELREPQRTGGS